jgi:hypothetical protein
MSLMLPICAFLSRRTLFSEEGYITGALSEEVCLVYSGSPVNTSKQDKLIAARYPQLLAISDFTFH